MISLPYLLSPGRIGPLEIRNRIVSTGHDTCIALREIVASHGYLPAQFLNPSANLREDDFGGSAIECSTR
jgi:2,4-dienoyl-CoA reductase-like NADH-dependent reductase (Old Yellow Enzyme family)